MSQSISKNKKSDSQAVNWGRQSLNLLLTLALALGLLGPATVPAARADSEPPRVHPALLQLAAEHPDDTFNVIIQREVKNEDLPDDDPEVEVEKEGGEVKRQLTLIESFSAELTGKKIVKLAKSKKIRWITFDAPMVSTSGPGLETVRDEFTDGTYQGNNGAANWSSNWIEVGDSTGTTGDLIQVVSNSACAGGSGYCLRLDPYSPTGKYVYRQADLSGVVSVWLSFYRNNLLNLNMGGYSEQVQLQVSANGGASWTTLRAYTGKAYTGAATDSFDISAYASANTQIRFLMPTYQSGVRYAYFDDIEIQFARPSAFLSAVKADQLALNGQGVTVAVVDSGLSTKTSDFMSGGASRIITESYFGDKSNARDEHGHGTHVAGLIGGNGAASGGVYRGMAPGVSLLNLRVSDKDGMAYESNVVDALQWIYTNKDLYNIRVVNLSLNSTVPESYHTSLLDAAVEILWFNGIVVVVSAGNNGDGAGPATVYPPANDPFVITVGASEDKGTAALDDDTMAVFSAYGATGDGFAKPDLVAPGRNLIAPLSDKAATVYEAHPTHRVGDYYFRMSGTSQSAPLVSGAVALLLQDEPNLTPDQVKYRLMATASTAWPAYDVARAGAGYLDILAAVNGTTTESANTGLAFSQLLGSGSGAVDTTVNWNSVNWNSVNWNSVNWNSVNWNSVNWNSVNWNSAVWDD